MFQKERIDEFGAYDTTRILPLPPPYKAVGIGAHEKQVLEAPPPHNAVSLRLTVELSV